MGLLDRRRAGDKAEGIWESGDLVDNPTTEAEWDLWEKFYKLVKESDGKGIDVGASNPGEGSRSEQFIDAYKDTRGTYIDNVYELHYEPSGMSREEFDAIYEKFEGTPAGEGFRAGEYGTDPAELAELGTSAQTSGSLGEFESKRDVDRAEKSWDEVERPELEGIKLTDFEAGPDLDLGRLDLKDAGDSAWTDNEDIEGSLGYYQDIVKGEGRDAVSDADFAKRAAEAEMRDRAQREATMRDAEVRGLSGSGVELAGDLAGQQARTSALHASGLDAAAMAQDRRDRSAMAAYGIAGDVATNEDAWSQWDTNRSDTEDMTNLELENEEARDTTARGRFVVDSNTGLRNEEVRYGADLPAREFGMDMAITGAKSGAAFQTGSFGADWDKYNQDSTWEKYKYEDSKPGVGDKILSGVQGVAGAVPGFGQVTSLFGPPPSRKGP